MRADARGVMSIPGRCIDAYHGVVHSNEFWGIKLFYWAGINSPRLVRRKTLRYLQYRSAEMDKPAFARTTPFAPWPSDTELVNPVR